MKYYISALLFALFVNGYSQKTTYELFSDVWEYEYKDGIQKMKPINSENFKMPTKELISKIDTTVINGLLLKSFNQFRSDYGKGEVNEDPKMTNQCKSYAKRLHKKYEHDKNVPDGHYEDIASISFVLLGNIDPYKQDINLIISQCVFDIFTSSEGHMRVLLSDEYKYFGFGASQGKSGLKICIRGRK